MPNSQGRRSQPKSFRTSSISLFCQALLRKASGTNKLLSPTPPHQLLPPPRIPLYLRSDDSLSFPWPRPAEASNNGFTTDIFTLLSISDTLHSVAL